MTWAKWFLLFQLKWWVVLSLWRKMFKWCIFFRGGCIIVVIRESKIFRFRIKYFRKTRNRFWCRVKIKWRRLIFKHSLQYWGYNCLQKALQFPPKRIEFFRILKIVRRNCAILVNCYWSTSFYNINLVIKTYLLLKFIKSWVYQIKTTQLNIQLFIYSFENTF